MKTDFDFPAPVLLGPVIFRPEFNSTEAVVDVNQAWSLFFTAGREDKILGSNPEVGRFFSYLLVAIGVTGILWATLFNHVA